VSAGGKDETGPMDESFYDAQRRHRRAGWRFTALALVGVVVTSLPVAVVLSPPLTALVVVVTDLLSVVVPTPDRWPTWSTCSGTWWATTTPGAHRPNR